MGQGGSVGLAKIPSRSPYLENSSLNSSTVTVDTFPIHKLRFTRLRCVVSTVYGKPESKIEKGRKGKEKNKERGRKEGNGGKGESKYVHNFCFRITLSVHLLSVGFSREIMGTEIKIIEIHTYSVIITYTNNIIICNCTCICICVNARRDIIFFCPSDLKVRPFIRYTVRVACVVGR